MITLPVLGFIVWRFATFTATSPNLTLSRVETEVRIRPSSFRQKSAGTLKRKKLASAPQSNPGRAKNAHWAFPPFQAPEPDPEAWGML